jgi:dipeptidyl aminopeptidase/acylaminoacyl peptidase
MPDEGQRGVIFESGGERLLGTLFLARGDGPRPAALILHGIPGIEKNYDLAHTLRDAGWNSLIFHYRGSWGSGGRYSIAGLPADVRAATDLLCAEPAVDADRLVVIGHSLGGWAAVLAAAADDRLRAVAVIGAVSDLRAMPMASEEAAAEYTPWLAGLTPVGLVEQWNAAGADPALCPVEQVAYIAPRPLLILHGGCDDVVSLAHAEALAARAMPPYDYRIHPDANHAFTWHRPWLREQILTWLNRLG